MARGDCTASLPGAPELGTPRGCAPIIVVEFSPFEPRDLGLLALATVVLVAIGARFYPSVG